MVKSISMDRREKKATNSEASFTLTRFQNAFISMRFALTSTHRKKIENAIVSVAYMHKRSPEWKHLKTAFYRTTAWRFQGTCHKHRGRVYFSHAQMSVVMFPRSMPAYSTIFVWKCLNLFMFQKHFSVYRSVF